MNDTDGQAAFARWELLFETLSLDKVVPFLPEMGLDMPRLEPLQAIARDFVRKRNQLPDDRIDAVEALLSETLANLSNAVGKVAARHFEDWTQTVVGVQRGNPHFGWQWLFRWLAGMTRQDIPLNQPNLDQDKIQPLVASIRRNFSDEMEIERRLEKAEQELGSSWDAEVYRSGIDGYSPLMWVMNVIMDYRVRQVWKEIELLLTAEEIELLVEWAKANSKLLDLSPEHIDRLR